jgi:manganese oxidase
MLFLRKKVLLFSLLALWFPAGPFQAEAAIDGLTGPTFTLTAGTGYVSTGDGSSVYFWGYGSGGTQYPGPTLIVTAGEAVTVTLTNNLPAPHNTSIIFPGQQVTTAGGTAGLLTNEAAPGGSVTYSFTPTKPGTYTYHSGTNADLQVEMGLFGALIVRPAGFDPLAPTAYGSLDTAYAREYLFLLSEMDYDIHSKAQFGQFNQIDTTTFKAVFWFINGRTGPDTMAMPNVSWLPSQPYNCMPRMHPGEKILLRFVGGGRDLHPLHTHGQHSRVIARDGRLLESIPGSGLADLSPMEFTVTVAPGQTTDSLYQWTGAKLGWDIYGTTPHSCLDRGDGFDNTTYEYCPDHLKPLPTIPPDVLNTLNGPWYSGSSLLGTAGVLPPGEGGFNPTSAYLYMFHSHNENEIVNFNIFPGGMLTMAAVEHPSVPLGPMD